MRLLVVCVFALAALASAQESDFQLSDYIQIAKNGNEVTGRSDDSIETSVEDFIKSHDVTFKLPVIGSTLTFAARNLDQDEVDVKFRFNDGQVEGKFLF